MFVLSLCVSVPPSIGQQIMDLFHLYRGPVSVLSGCEGINLYNNSANHLEFILIEEWSSQHSLENHIMSDDFRKILAIMDLSNRPPELKIRSIQWEKGFEMVEKLRNVEERGGR